MSDLSPLSGVKRKLDFGAVRAALDPQRTYSVSFIPNVVSDKFPICDKHIGNREQCHGRADEANDPRKVRRP